MLDLVADVLAVEPSGVDIRFGCTRVRVFKALVGAFKGVLVTGTCSPCFSEVEASAGGMTTFRMVGGVPQEYREPFPPLGASLR